MSGKNCLGGTALTIFIIACLTAACALNVASSKLSSGDRPPVVTFPKRVGVATLTGNLAAQQEATTRLSRGLIDLGFQVVTSNWNVDKVLGRWAEGVFETIPEPARRQLQEQYGLEGIFVGILSQDQGNVVNETRLSLRLISVPTGKLVWSANVLGGGVAGLSGGVKDTALAAVQKALASLEKDLYKDPKENKQGTRQTSSTLQLKGIQSKKSD
ncbi:MAG TPA: hypothetical protein VKF36_16010 [Syntrophorhabdales bacterium]|nr:hypothetical protein [Syntrophorhabdales bacterium]